MCAALDIAGLISFFKLNLSKSSIKLILVFFSINSVLAILIFLFLNLLDNVYQCSN